MAGNPQGGGAPRPNMGNAGPAMQNWQNTQQNMQQNMAGMPSQYPGANIAAPGGGMANAAVMPQGQGSNMANAAVMPQQQNQNPQIYSALPAYAGPVVMPQGQGQQAMMMDARVLPNGATVDRNDPRFYQGMGQQPPAVMPRPTPVPQAQPMPRPAPAPQGGFDLSGGAPMNREQAINAFMQGARERQNMARPQIQGNPNSMPVQRAPRRNMMGG